jgi:DNA repair protein RecN (Recombination protein N)
VLETLTIRNVAVIDSAEIPFSAGLNILSGETGAGKSIVIEAISLLLGSRANAELIRSGCEEAVVQGLFDLGQIPWMRERLSRHGIPVEQSELLVKRVVRRDGKHRIYINGELATLAMLQDICDGLVDLCGQHEHQSLLRPATQLDLLDRYGTLTESVRAVAQAFSSWRGLTRERDTLRSAEAERVKRADFLRFQIQELRDAQLSPGEDEKLQQEKQLLQSTESRLQAANSIFQALDSEDGGLLDGLRAALQKLRGLAQMDASVRPLQEGLERALAEAEEVSIALGRYVRGNDLDPERLEQVQERLSLIADLRRKYGATVADMLEQLSRLEAEFSQLGQLGSRLEEIEAELEKAEKDLRARARKLSQSRRKISDLLATSVTAELKDLKMGEATFQIELNARDDLATWTASGADEIQYVVQTNRGEPARPLGKIASGGELSRLMLAIRRVIADRGGIGVYLFDEIDAGIGGQTAFQVGKKLKSVAQYNQVICITHLPQVASFADHHLVVQKSTRGDRTLTEVHVLSKDERKEELARMLGGPQLTKKSLENAAELLDMAR